LAEVVLDHDGVIHLFSPDGDEPGSLTGVDMGFTVEGAVVTIRPLHKWGSPNMSAERIEISLIPQVQGHGDVYPHPYPATKALPEWFKSMPNVAEGQGNSIVNTVKICPPFTEAMICGYIIPLATDISLTVDSAGRFVGGSNNVEIVHHHFQSQVKGAPFEKYTVVKILSPWLIRTPPGYSTLFQPLLNRYDMPLIPLAGVVETDLFYMNVNFPAILMVPPGTRFTLPRGAPLVQAIPFKREEFQTELVPVDVEKYNATNLGVMENPNFYKNNFWRKKTYR
jgi:hypothetical protein